MIRTAEAVLDGHPDKFCDILADELLGAVQQAEPDYSAQVEVAVWGDVLWFGGGIVTRTPIQINLPELVKRVGRALGYTRENHIEAERYRIHDELCFDIGDPLPWSENVNDQSIVIGWAGYDAGTHFLPPEQFLVHSFRRALIQSCRDGVLRRQGPDGKLLVRLREEPPLNGRAARWILEHVLVTLQQTMDLPLTQLANAIEQTLDASYTSLREHDLRWFHEWRAVELLVNPNGALVYAGSDGDSGQTGRKLVMDYYGPRIPLGGGALSGKDFPHIDRIGAYGARAAALTAIGTGAKRCQVTLIYAPNRARPLDVIYEMEGRGDVLPREWFEHGALVERFARHMDIARLGNGEHFFDLRLPWNASCAPA